MSAVFGIFHRAGAMVQRQQLEKIIHPLIVWGPDRQAVWSDGAVGLGHLALITTPEELHETQPIHGSNGNLVLVADCRIDNRDALAISLDVKERVSTLSDANLILLAYEKWQEGCVNYLLGDYAFVVWDRKKNCLFCARDPLGMRPLFYRNQGNEFLFASHIQAIRDTGRVSRWNTDYLVDFLYFGGVPAENNQTPYPDIFRVPKGSFLVVTPSEVNIKTFRKLQPEKEITYKRREEYAEHFLELLTRSVHNRLRSVGPVAVLMSGGLDSTSIYSLAKSCLTNPNVFPISAVFDRYKEQDERYYINMVLEKYGRDDHEFVISDDMWMLKGLPNFSPPTEEPNRTQLTHAFTYSVYERAVKRGARVVLSGHAGDEALGFTPYYVADYLKKMKILPFIKESRELAKVVGGTVYSVVKEYGIRALRGIHEQPTILLPGIYQQAKERNTIEETIRFPGQRAHYQYINRAQGFSHAQFYISEPLGIETRYPFLDLSVVQFLLNIPIEQKIHNAQSKVILRKAMRGIVPDGVLDRKDKTGNDAMIFTGLKKEWHHLYPLLMKSRLHEMGLIDGKKLLGKIDSYRQGVLCEGMDYFAALLLELWLASHS